MKKIDKLVLVSFIGPFAMTFVVVFILLSRHKLLFFDDIIGKDLGWLVLSELLFYFLVFMIPIALPLAVLLSSLMTFGNLAEHYELTAIKSAGISLLRTILSIFGFVAFLSVVNPWQAFWIPPSIFLSVGFALLMQARVDSRLIEADAYRILVDQLGGWLIKRGAGSNKESRP